MFSIESENEIKNVVNYIKEKYPKSVHTCYGAIINNSEILKNDSEVGNPGKMLLSILKNKKQNNKILIVSRIYGGVKLGPSGVGREFRKVGMGCF